MAIFISLLRGINVGGNKIIKMDALRTLCESAGLTQVRTYLQSGNVVFASEQTDRAQLIAQLEAGIQQLFGFSAEVILRSPEEISRVIDHHPLSPDKLADPKRLLVMFLSSTPSAAAIDSLLKTFEEPEEIHPRGQEIYLYYPDGVGRSKLAPGFIEKQLKVSGTARNWNTVTALLTLAQGPTTS
jgi:uncharacterized protein (DUF1697 family)